MANSSQPPEEQASVKPFNPLVLDRTVIAVPLLMEMKQDFEHIQAITKRHPDAARTFNAAIEYHPDYPGGAQPAHERVVGLAREAAEKARSVFTDRLSSLSRRSPPTARSVSRRSTRRSGPKLIQPPMAIAPDISISFARLHSSIIRRLLAAGSRLARAGSSTRSCGFIRAASKSSSI